MRAYYSLMHHPATYDFVAFLTHAITLGAKSVVFDLSEGYCRTKFPEIETRRMYSRVIRPICTAWGIPFEEGRKVSGDISPSYRIWDIELVKNVKIQKLRKQCEGYHTFTIRESIRNKHRDSRKDEWIKVANEKEGCVIVEDAYKKFISIPDRIDLYSKAKMNWFVGNGPGALAWFSDIPHITFHQHATVTPTSPHRPNFQYPWSLPDQKVLYAEDTYENILREWNLSGY